MLLWLAALYCAASLAHFVHNAEYLAQYPNLPLVAAALMLQSTLRCVVLTLRKAPRTA